MSYNMLHAVISITKLPSLVFLFRHFSAFLLFRYRLLKGRNLTTYPPYNFVWHNLSIWDILLTGIMIDHAVPNDSHGLGFRQGMHQSSLHQQRLCDESWS